MGNQQNSDPARPAFMVALGLLPPYALDDVEAAYRSRVLKVHPDRGGNVADFLIVQEAYDHAVEYVRFHGDRRSWIAARVEVYLRQQEAADEVARLGGQVEMEEIDWLKHSLGDGFAQLAERLRAVSLQDTKADDAFVSFLAVPPSRAPYLLMLNLSGTRITDAGLQALSGFELLKNLNLTRTRVTARGLQELPELLPYLELIDMQSTEAGFLSRWRLQRVLRRRRADVERGKGVYPPP